MIYNARKISYKFQNLIIDQILTPERRKALRVNKLVQLSEDLAYGRLEEDERKKFDNVMRHWDAKGFPLRLLTRSLKVLKIPDHTSSYDEIKILSNLEDPYLRDVEVVVNFLMENNRL